MSLMAYAVWKRTGSRRAIEQNADIIRRFLTSSWRRIRAATAFRRTPATRRSTMPACRCAPVNG